MYKENASFTIGKEELVFLKDDDDKLIEHITHSLSQELANRLIKILDKENEVIARKSHLRVDEVPMLNSIEYRASIGWKPLIRCKDCKHRFVDGDNVRFNVCELNHNKVQADDWFCADAERREE